MQISRRALVMQITAASIPLITSARVARADTTQYVYDSLGRLRRVTFDNGATVDYAYDAVGNRTAVARNAAPFIQTIQITGTGPVNLRSLANAAGYTGAQDATITFQLGSSVTITGSAGAPSGGIAIDTGTWPTSNYAINLTLQVSGKAYGGGGKGGTGAVLPNGTAGGIGGDALYCRLPMSVTVNTGGEIKAGGGGGGGGGGRDQQLDPPFDPVGGGGGGGFPNGPGGLMGASSDGSSAGASNGATGTTSGGGAGGSGETSGGGAGGAGGGAGANGSTGNGGSGAGTVKTAGAGGVAGYAIRKNSNTVTVTNSGTITGTVG